MADATDKKNPVLTPPVAGGKTAAKTDAIVSPPPVAAAVAAPPVSSPALFGGHRGGGKKRLDGLVAGSAEAIKVDKEKHAKRMREARAAEKNAALPSPLARPVVSAAPKGSPLAAAEPAAAAAAADSPVAPVPFGNVFPTFVAWSQKKVERIVRQLVKISGRVVGWAKAKKIQLLKLAPHREKEIVDKMQWKAEIVEDLSVSLSEAITIELNERQARGAKYAHWITAGVCLSELVAHEVENFNLLDRLILEDRAEKALAAEKAEGKKI